MGRFACEEPMKEETWKVADNVNGRIAVACVTNTCAQKKETCSSQARKTTYVCKVLCYTEEPVDPVTLLDTVSVFQIRGVVA